MQKKNNFLRNMAATVACLAALTAFSGCGNKNPESVVINGIRWATRNVDAPGTFVSNPEDYGQYYQYNRKSTELLRWDDYDNTSASHSSTWLFSNDPSPAGYRVPTKEEISSLLDESKVRSKWTTKNGIGGVKFTDKSSGNSIFLPAAGQITGDGSNLTIGKDGHYGSSTRGSEGGGGLNSNSCLLGFYDYNNGQASVVVGRPRNWSCSVRPVAE